MSNNTKRLEELQLKKPHGLLEDAPPQIRDYVLSLEDKLVGLLSIQGEYDEVSVKYIDAQEDLLSMQLQIVDCKDTIKQLTNENDILRSENEKLIKSRNQISTFDPPVGAMASLLNRSEIGSDSNANSVLVKGYPQEIFDNDPNGGIVHLVSLMNLKITEADIRKVTQKKSNFYERQNMQPDKLILIVELANSETKVDILKHKEKLKVHPKAKDIEITDFVSANVYNLYQYAKILKSHGYHSVYWRNNSVYAKKAKSISSQPILIESTSQVDVLKANP